MLNANDIIYSKQFKNYSGTVSLTINKESGWLLFLLFKHLLVI